MSIGIKIEFRTQTRGYTLHMERDLLGDIYIVRHWYGLHTKRGGFKRDIFSDFEEAKKLYQRLIGRRLRRGYTQLPITK